MLTLALRNVFRQKVRTALTLAAIGLGVAGLILTGGFVEDVLVQLREATIHSQIGHLQIHKAGFAAEGRRDPYRYLIADPAKAAEVARAQPHVVDVLMRIEFSGLINNGRTDQPIVGEGVEPDKEARLGTLLSIVAGRQLGDGDTFGILLGEGVARGLKLKPGEYVTVLANTPEGALNTLELHVVGVFRSFSKEFDDRAVRIPLAGAQELLTTPAVHALVVSLDDTAMTDTVRRHLRAELPADQFEIAPWYELADFYQKTVELYRTQFGVLQIIVLVMVVLGVANTINTTVYERTGEFGTLMALGNRGQDIFQLTMTENLILGLVGAVAGGLLGVALAWLLTAIGIEMPPLPNSEIGYTATIRAIPSVVLTAMAIGVLATVAAAIVPARRASRLKVAEALRENV